MLVVKFLLIANLFYLATCQDETTEKTSPKFIIDVTTTTVIPKVPETTEKTTTPMITFIFDTPEKVNVEKDEAFEDLSRTVNETLANFNEATREKLNEETGHIFQSLEKEELFNKYQDYCSTDDLTAYEEYQTSIDEVIKHWLDAEHPKIDAAFKKVYADWIVPFRRDVEVNLITPITTNLRFPKGNLDKYVGCANQYVPQVLKLIELAFTNVLDCNNMTINYKETSEYAELIGTLYKQTAAKFTTCNEDPECYASACPEMYLLVIQSVAKASDAMSSIVRNFQKEVENIPKCATAKFNNAAYLKTKDQLRLDILQCLR